MFLSVSLIQSGAASVVALAVILVLTGRLVPRRNLEDVRKDRDARIEEARAEAATWRRAWELERDVRELQAKHIEELLEFGRTTTRVLSALPPVQFPPAGERTPDVVA